MTLPMHPLFPENGDIIPAPSRKDDMLRVLAHRRSTLAKNLCEPGPTHEETALLIQFAARTPDHGKLFPWRFIVFENEARDQLSAKLHARFKTLEPEATTERLELERRRFNRAPLVIGVISKTQENHKIPEWEQILSAGAVCQNLLIAAEAMGYGAQWLTEWYAFDQDIKTEIDLKPGERVAGFIYIGRCEVDRKERSRKPADISYWTQTQD